MQDNLKGKIEHPGPVFLSYVMVIVGDKMRSDHDIQRHLLGIEYENECQSKRNKTSRTFLGHVR